MPIRWILWGTLMLYQKSPYTSAQEDLEAAAITVYRNPEFFRHLSAEFNNYVHDFTSDRPKAPRDEYVSPFHSEPFSNTDLKNSENEQHAPEMPEQESYEDEDDSGAESEGGGFNTYNEESEKEHIMVPEYEELTEDEEFEEQEDDGYKYPGEPKKPNSPGRPSVGGGHFDPSPDFEHPPRRLAPKKPKKKGRGPYGHPKLTNQYTDSGTGDEENERLQQPADYQRDFDDDGKESGRMQLEDIETDNWKHMKKAPTAGDVGQRQELKVFHNGQKYPISVQPYSQQYEPLQQTFPLGYYHDYNPSTDELYHPSTQYNYYPTNDKPFRHYNTAQKQPLKIGDTKKGTREYLKYHKYPPNHELREVDEPKTEAPKKGSEIVGCNTKITPKRPRQFAAYHIRPVYAHYRVVPVYYKKPLYKRRVGGKRRSVSKQAKPKADEKRLVVNSELDQDYQTLKIVINKS